MGRFQRRLVKFVVGVVRHPRLTLLIGGLVLVASVGFAFLHLQVSTNEDALLTPKLPFFRQYKQFENEFPENDSYVVILQPEDYAHPPTAARWEEFADRLTAGLSALPEVVRVDSHVSPDQIGIQGMEFDDWPDIKDQSQHLGDFIKFAHIVGDPNSPESIGISLTDGALLTGSSMTQRVLAAASHDKPEDTAPLAAEVMRTLANAIRSPRPFDQWTTDSELPSLARADPQAATDPRQVGYNMIGDETKRNNPAAYRSQQILVINVYTKPNDSSLSKLMKPLDEMRAVVARTARDFPDFRPPVITGREAMQVDQMRTSEHDTRLAEICGLSLVFIMLFVFLRNLWLVIAAELCLGVGIGWTFGWATLAVGRLNLLSLVFVIALIGIGMDYLIQILVRYRFEKKRYARPEAVWARVFKFVSAPICTACCGAAAAFFVAMLTDFHGAAELGLIAGGGLLLCLASGYTVLPALLTLFPAAVGKVPVSRRYPRQRPGRLDLRHLTPVVVWIAIAAVGLLVALPPHFDPNLIKLQDDDLDSVQAVRKLQSWSEVILSPSLDKLRQARAAVADLPSVDHTESLLDAQDKRQWLLDHNAAATKVSWHTPDAPTAAQLNALAGQGEKLAAQWEKLPANGGPVIDDSSVLAAAHALAAAIHDPSIPEADKLARAVEWQRRFVDEVRMNVDQLAPPPLDIASLPVSLHNHLVSVNTPQPIYALYIYPKADLWNFDNLGTFVNQIEPAMDAFKARTGSDVILTGVASQLYYSTHEIQRAFLHSTMYAMIAIVLLVLLDMRNIVQTLLAVSVLLLGLPMLLLAMYIWRVWLHDPFEIMGSWNLANFFALPILIGAGHEYGVFMVHRYRESLVDPRRVWRGWDVADRALLLCGIVTSCSFGFLVFARHHGLQSLGWVMAVGTACIYLSALLVLRPILLWRLHAKKVFGHAPVRDPKLPRPSMIPRHG